MLDALFAHGRAMERSELYQAMGTASPSAALRELVKGEVLTLETSISRGVGDKTELVAQLAVPYVQAQERISPRAKQQQAAAAFLDEYPVASVKDIGYFTGVKLGTLRAGAQRAGDPHPPGALSPGGRRTGRACPCRRS